MKLNDMKRTGRDIALYARTVADAAGAVDYELAISGSRAISEKAFAKCDFQVTISPNLAEAAGADSRWIPFSKSRLID